LRKTETLSLSLSLSSIKSPRNCHFIQKLSHSAFHDANSLQPLMLIARSIWKVAFLNFCVPPFGRKAPRNVGGGHIKAFVLFRVNKLERIIFKLDAAYPSRNEPPVATTAMSGSIVKRHTMLNNLA